MFLLRDTNGLVVLLSSAVLLGILVLGAMSLCRVAPRHSQTTAAAKAISEAATKAPTDAHMALIVAGKMLRQLVRNGQQRAPWCSVPEPPRVQDYPY
jgi:hypothetical protein